MAGHERPGDREVYESVPWQDLVDLRSDRRRWVYPAVALTLLGVLVFGVARTFRPSPQVLTVPTTVASPSPAAPDPPVTVPPPAPVVERPAGGSALPPSAYAEADLLAVEQATLSATAGAVAEWFLVEWLTVDGTEPAGWIAATAGAPHHGSGRSYVEWARATAVEPLDAGRFRVEVAVRRLAAGDPSSGYVRVPDGMFEVVVDLTGDGSVVVDLPRPLPVTFSGPLGDWGPPVPEPPDGVVAAAREAAGAPTGAPVTVWSIGAGWRAVVALPDSAGVEWPVAVWVSASGEAVPAGSTG
jgi:hypothetical protein